MTLVRALTLGLTLLFAAAATAEDKPAAKFDAEKLVGTWKVTGGKKGGEKASEDAMKATITITKDKITIEGDTGKFVMGYKILPADVVPTQIDMEILEPKEFASKAQGIIEIKGDTFTLCYHPMGGARPKKFEATADNGNYLFEHKKVEAKKGDK